MENYDKILHKYYEGRTSLEEEKELRKNYSKSNLEEHIMLSDWGKEEIPENLYNSIKSKIQEPKKSNVKKLILIWGSAAAVLLMFFTLKAIIPTPVSEYNRFSENIQRERFEDALRLIGNILDEKEKPAEKIIYENNDMIISVNQNSYE